MAIILDRENKNKEFQQKIETIKKELGLKSSTKAVMEAIDYYVDKRVRFEARLQELAELKDELENKYYALSSAYIKKLEAEQRINDILLKD